VFLHSDLFLVQFYTVNEWVIDMKLDSMKLLLAFHHMKQSCLRASCDKVIKTEVIFI